MKTQKNKCIHLIKFKSKNKKVMPIDNVIDEFKYDPNHPNWNQYVIQNYKYNPSITITLDFVNIELLRFPCLFTAGIGTFSDWLKQIMINKLIVYLILKLAYYMVILIGFVNIRNM